MRLQKTASLFIILLYLFIAYSTSISFSLNTIPQEIKLRIYFNEKPDSLFINGQLYDIQSSGEIVKIERKEENVIRAVKKGYKPLYQELNNLRKYVFNNVRLKFEIKEYFLDDFASDQHTQLPIITYLGQKQLLNPDLKIPILLANSIILTSTSLALLSNIDYGKVNCVGYTIVYESQECKNHRYQGDLRPD